MINKTLKVEIINENITPEDLKNKLMNLTSDTFNGKAGEKYFNDVFIGDKIFKFSGLDTYMIDFNPDECDCPRINYIADFIETIFFDNSHYENYTYDIAKNDNELIVATVI